MAGEETKPKLSQRITFKTLGKLCKIRTAMIDSLQSKTRRLSAVSADGDAIDNTIVTEPDKQEEDSSVIARKHLMKWKTFAQTKPNRRSSVISTSEDAPVALDRRKSSNCSDDVFEVVRRHSLQSENITDSPGIDSLSLSVSVPCMTTQRRASLLPSLVNQAPGIPPEHPVPDKTDNFPYPQLSRRSSQTEILKSLSDNTCPLLSTRNAGLGHKRPFSPSVHRSRTIFPLIRTSTKITRITHHLHREQSSVWSQSVRINSKLQRYLKEKKSSYSTAKLNLIYECQADLDMDD